MMTTAGPQTPPVEVGSAQLAATGAVDGFAIFHLIPGAQEAVVPLETRNASSYLLAFDNTGGVVLGVAVANVSAQAAVIPVVIRDDTGARDRHARRHYFRGRQRPLFVRACRRCIRQPPTSAAPLSSIRRLADRSACWVSAPRRWRTTTLTTIPALANVGISGGSIAHIATRQRLADYFRAGQHRHQRGAGQLEFLRRQTGAPLSLPLAFPQSGGGTDHDGSVGQPNAGRWSELDRAERRAAGESSTDYRFGAAHDYRTTSAAS